MLHFYAYRTEIFFLKISVFFPNICNAWEHKILWTLNFTHEKKQEPKDTLKDKYFFINNYL
jgi:hypothetical protein